MFTVYTPNGRTFSGPLEHLRQIEKPLSSKSSRKQEDIDEQHIAAKKEYSVTPKAIEAYREVIKKPDTKEEIHHAYQVMTSPVHAISSKSSMAVVMEQFNTLPFQMFPIVDDNNQLIGSISRQEIYQHLYAMGSNDSQKLKSQSIASVSLNEHSKVFAAQPITDIRRIAALMVEHEVHAVPILENDGSVVGIVSRTDVLKAIMTDPPLSLWC